MKKYAELIEYLMAKDANINALEMDFEGKNIMLYHLGTDRDSLSKRQYTIPLRDPSLPAELMCRGVATPEHWWNLSQTALRRQRGACNHETCEGVC